MTGLRDIRLFGEDKRPLGRSEEVRPLIEAGTGSWAADLPPEKLRYLRAVIRARCAPKPMTDFQCDRIIEGIWPHVRERWWRRVIDARLASARTYVGGGL